MRAGRMDRRVTIERIELVDVDGGQFEEQRTVLATVWAEVQQESGRQFFEHAQIQTDRRAVFRMHWIAGLRDSDELVFDGWRWEIHERREIGRRQGLQIHAVGREN